MGEEGRLISHSGGRGDAWSPHSTETWIRSANGGHLAFEDFSLTNLFLPDYEEELEGLTQDWISLNKCRAQLITRKRDLEIL